MVDEAASALRLAQESKPDELQSLDRAIMTLEIELESLKKESDLFSVERRNKVEQDLREKRDESEKLTAMWQAGMHPFSVLRGTANGPLVQKEIVYVKSRT